jgi:transketolase
MLTLDSSSTRQWSRLGPRAVYGQALLDIASYIPNLIALSADLGNSSGLDRFRNSYPDRFINVGVAEQNLVGVAAGIAKEGFVCFASSFAPFITMRAAEQVRMNLAYMQLNVKTVGIGSGVAMGLLGNSHFGVEDVAVMRSIPGMTIVSPADCGELVKVLQVAAVLDTPMYIRLTGVPNCPVVYSEDYQFTFGKAHQLRSGRHVALLASGTMVANSLLAARTLESSGISVSVYNFHTIKPLDTVSVSDLASQHEVLVTVEEHSIIGGLGSAISEHLSALRSHPPLLRIGLSDEFGESGSYQYLLKKHGLTPEGISEAVQAFFRTVS